MLKTMWLSLPGRPVGRRPAPWRALMILAALALALASPVAAATYVDGGLPDLTAEQKVVASHPQPVQLLFQFKTKGAPNAAATKQVKPDVIATVKASGLFSEVSDGPTPNGAVLNIIIDDVVAPKDMHDAEAKGFVTGATFFVAGSNIRENYASKIEYVAGPSAPTISASAQHSIIMQMGLINSPPENAVKVDGGIKGAVTVMVRQIVSNPLNVVARDPGFQGAAPPAAMAAPTPAGDPPAPTVQDAPAAPAPTPAADPAKPTAQAA